MKTLTITKVTYKKTKLQFKEPFVFKIETYQDKIENLKRVRKLLIVESSILGIYAYTFRKHQLIYEVKKQIVESWLKYVRQDDKLLTARGKELKRVFNLLLETC